MMERVEIRIAHVALSSSPSTRKRWDMGGWVWCQHVDPPHLLRIQQFYYMVEKDRWLFQKKAAEETQE
jgi:hypothetical protein